ncbi:trimeric intracellular cation channel family protein [Bifidobacterium biavatii]|uniref:Membrane protein n=1 Tax=Bifidobacterium biavatii DSM 23969 TaxID=1437608 RepID=A0A087A0D7_9BIFI|nr:TRIC cation channel family protein [Bifidobacterium biavatii]KFI52237.1 membrane protein [Bifidobacterium biavatii DSM 23969]
MELALESNAFFMGVEYLAVFCCGLMGGLCAVRKNYDLIAMLITAWLTALGGGIVRDIVLGSLPPVGISDKGFVITALVSGLVVAVFHPEVDKLKWSMLTIDALSVGLFAVNGTSKAMILGMSGMTSVFLGVITALGGGLVRDMLLNDVPMFIRDKHWYAIPSAVGSVLTVFVCKGVQAHVLNFNAEVVLDVSIVVLVVVMRLLSVKFNITMPGAMVRHEIFLPSQSKYLQRPVIHPHVEDDDRRDGGD